jgi:hypothetical protein
LGIEEGDAECLIEAVNAYRLTLDGVDRDLAPFDWAMTQNNLGNALRSLGESETGSGRLYHAAAAYRAALGETAYQTHHPLRACGGATRKGRASIN